MPTIPRPRCNAPALVLALATLLAPAVQAQTHRCMGVNGPYYSDRPCPIQGGTKLGAYGPAPEAPPPRPGYQRAPAPVGPAPEYQSYMSAECASLNDGLRTAASRGLNPITQQDLRRDYHQRCADDEARARQKLSRERSLDRQARLAEERQAEQAVQRVQVQQQRSAEQCGEMRRIVASKTQRLGTMTPGEVADFRRFEQNFAERCPSMRQATP